MKTTRFLSVAVFAAIAFNLFACSSDDSDDNTGGGGAVPSTNANGDQTYKVDGAQVYILGLPSRPYDGNATTLVGANCNSGTVGRIENGKLFLDLPGIEDPDIFDEDGICEEEFAVEGTNLYAELFGTTKGLTQVAAKDDVIGAASFLYVSKTGEFTDPDDPEFKLNFKKGWNIVYFSFANGTVTVGQPISGLKWEWGLND